MTVCAASTLLSSICLCSHSLSVALLLVGNRAINQRLESTATPSLKHKRGLHAAVFSGMAENLPSRFLLYSILFRLHPPRSLAYVFSHCSASNSFDPLRDRRKFGIVCHIRQIILGSLFIFPYLLHTTMPLAHSFCLKGKNRRIFNSSINSVFHQRIVSEAQ